MADYKVTDTQLTSIANAIRTKGGTSALLEFPQGFIDAIAALPGGEVEIVPFSTGTDAQIGAIIDAARAGTLDLQQDAGWSVGDTRTITINGFTIGGGRSIASQDIDIYITSFDDYNNSGAIMQFDVKTPPVEEYFRMHSSNSNVGGYGNSEMKTTTLPAFVNALPDWLKNRLIEFPVLVSEGGRSSNVVSVSGNKLALRSAIERYGWDNATEYYTVAGEGTAMPILKGGRQTKTGVNRTTWSRSPSKVDIERYVIFTGSAGALNDATATILLGIVPFGCL